LKNYFVKFKDDIVFFFFFFSVFVTVALKLWFIYSGTACVRPLRQNVCDITKNNNSLFVLFWKPLLFGLLEN